ncbi:MAG: molybdopterin molybdotransferase MoeA [Ferroplasma sp.]
MSTLKHIMKNFDPFLSYDSILNLFDKLDIKKPAIENIAVESSMMRISAIDVISGVNIPGFNRSAMDGYAINSADSLDASDTNPVKLSIEGVQGPGRKAITMEGKHKCIEIYTGAEMPAGCDAVIKVEDTERSGNDILLYSECHPYLNVSRIGEDIKSGYKITSSNHLITAGQIAAMVATNIKFISVYKKIQIGIINTGDEVINGTIKNSTGALLSSFYSNNYIEARIAGLCNDDISSIKNTVSSALDKFDIIIVTGGSSLGESDMATAALEQVGKPLFSGVAIKPGQTMALFYNQKPVISVSGLPVAALISSLVIINRYIKNLFSFELYSRAFAILDTNIHKKIGFTTFHLAHAYVGENGLHVRPLNTTASGNISGIIDGNCMIMINDDREGIEAGKQIMIYLIGEIKWD